MLLEQQDFWSFFNPDVEIYMPPDDGDLSVKPKGKRAHHHGRIHPTEFLGFLDFFGLFFQGWGSYTSRAWGRVPLCSSDLP